MECRPTPLHALNIKLEFVECLQSALAFHKPRTHGVIRKLLNVIEWPGFKMLKRSPLIFMA